jgi:hypothetical protein
MIALLLCSLTFAQNQVSFDLEGNLELVDRPPAATSVEALHFQFRPQGGGIFALARPDQQGHFQVRGVGQGRYSLVFPMPGRIVMFAQGDRALDPAEFEMHPSDKRPIRLVISMKTGAVAVSVTGLPSGARDVAAVLVPADSYLTIREGCSVNRLTRPATTFSFVPPGRYRIIVVDEAQQGEIARYAPRFPEFLKASSTWIDVVGDEQRQAVAAYVDRDTVARAVHRIGQLDPQ